MGGGSSVLSPELSESLTQPSLEEFHRLQIECEEKHMTPVEMYLFLSKKYEDLIRAERQAVKEIQSAMKSEHHNHHKPGQTEVRRKSLTTEHHSTDGIADDVSHVRRGSLKDKAFSNGASSKETNHNSAGTSPHRHRSVAEQIEEQTLQQDIQFALACLDHESDSDDDSHNAGKKDRIEFNPIHDPYVESVVGKVFQVKDTTSSKSHPQIKQLLHTLLPSSSTTNAILSGHPPTGGHPQHSHTAGGAPSGGNGSHSPRFAAVVHAAKVAAAGTGHLPSPNSARNSARSDPEKDKESHSAMNTSRRAEEHNNNHNHSHGNLPSAPVVSEESVAAAANKTYTDFVINNSIIHHDLTTGILTCQVCQMDFENRANLDIHLSHSSLHAMNLRIRQDIFNGTVQEAERLATLAKMALGRFVPVADQEAAKHGAGAATVSAVSPRTGATKSPPLSATSRSNPSSTTANKTIPYIYTRQYDIHHRWKKAINRVIATRLKQQFLPIVEQLFSTPPGIRMLYAGEKYFYQVKASFDIHIYLHVAIDLLEVVIHTLPSKKIREKQKKKIMAQQASHSPKGHTDSPKQETQSPSFTSFINPLNRMYLDFNVIVPLVLGVDKSESTLQEVEAANLAFHHVEDATKPAVGVIPTVVSNQFVSGVTSRIAAINSTSKDREDTIKLNKTIEQAVVSFISNRLRAVTDDAPTGGPVASLLAGVSTPVGTPKTSVRKAGGGGSHHVSKVTKVVLDVSAFAHNPLVEESRLKDYALKQQLHSNTLANSELDQLLESKSRKVEFKPVPVDLEVLRKHYENKFLKDLAEQQEQEQNSNASPGAVNTSTT